MNLFRRILGTNPDPPVIQEHTPKPMSAGERLDSLESRQSRLEEQIKQEKTKAKSYMDKGNKSGIML
jgi:tRNA(Ile2) C34 agmatinyltransferase TiaS